MTPDEDRCVDASPLVGIILPLISGTNLALVAAARHYGGNQSAALSVRAGETGASTADRPVSRSKILPSMQSRSTL